MRRRLLVSYLALAVVVLVVLEIPLGLLVTRRERDNLRTQASQDASSLAALAGEVLERSSGSDLDRLARRYEQQTHAEVLIVDRRGGPLIVLTPSEREGSADLATETASALKGRVSVTSRTDEGRPVESAARPIADPGGQRRGAVVVSIPSGAAHQRVRVVVDALAVLAAVVLAVAGIVAWLLSRSIAEPLARLEWATRHLGEGDLGTRVAEQGPPELRSLARGFNRMADRLDELVDSQRRFVADASHQLRSPLTALRLRLENVGANSDAKARRNLEQADEEVARLSHLVDGLLALARSEGSRPIRLPLDVDLIIRDRAAMWSALAVERSIELFTDLGARSLMATAVAGYLEQILDSLLANAIEASPPGGRVGLRSTAVGDTVEVSVTDEGPGMDETQRRAAFGRFWQGAPTTTGSSGLGLPIARQLARACGGDLTLHRSPSGGLEAVVRLDAS
ncbi:MAG: HAMP domain-containing histidine kinase [Actinomycetota bacterium]|nr:HAMP domain-containing histidine kinase [Actinomycetota bacterium]